MRHIRTTRFLVSPSAIAFWRAVVQDSEPAAISLSLIVGSHVGVLRTLIPKTVGVSVRQLCVSMDPVGVENNITVKMLLVGALYRSFREVLLITHFKNSRQTLVRC